MIEQTTTNYCIVTRGGSGPVALVLEGGSLQLPVVMLQADIWPPEQAAEINGQLMDHFGLNCTLLRWLEKRIDSNLLVMEWHPGSPAPEIGVEWVDPETGGLPLPPDQLRMVRTWRGASQENLVPWERPGWMQGAVMWLMKIFNGAQHPRLTNLAQIKAGWGMSTLLHIQTTGGEYFFKAGSRLGIDEWKLLRILHDRFPDRITAPFRVSENDGWMILRGIDHMPYAPLDLEGLGRAFRYYAEIQLGCVDLHKSGLAPGLRVRDAAWLRAQATSFFTADGVAEEFSGLRTRLGPDELTSLEARWRQLIDALEAAVLPLTLNHEDLHFENILNTAHGPVLIDWADCAMAHPFFCLHRILSLWGDDLSDDYRREREAVRSAYLGAFRHLADEARLSDEIETTGQLWSLYRAFRWQRLAQGHRGESYWSDRCRENAIRFMNEAIEQALESEPADDSG